MLRRTDLLPAWFAWLGVAAGAVALLLPEDGSAFGFVSLGRFPSLLWLLAAAVLLNGRPRRTT